MGWQARQGQLDQADVEQEAAESMQLGTNQDAELVIYVAGHCSVCQYAYEVADDIKARFPGIRLRVVDIETTSEAIPDAVFATPTYLLNEAVWSLGNPSPARIAETLSAYAPAEAPSQP